MNGNVTREGITSDLEAMRDVGIGGFQAFHISTSIPAGPVKYMSPEWRGMMTHAVREADRLGLEVCLHNCAGWSSSGGPWVTPDHSMFEVVWTEARETGDGPIRVERPPARLDYYGDICVLAFPTPQREASGKPGFRLKQVRGKAGFDRLDAPQHDQRTAPADAVIPRRDIIDLTTRLRPDDTLDWTKPAGDWTILRFGYTPTLRTNHPAPDEGRGLECDKLSAAGSDQHWHGIVQKVLDDAGDLAGRTLNNVLIDSYETGQQNWTHEFASEFRRRRGYALYYFLPALTGRVVDDVEVTERFLWDFRRTIADLFSENYYGRFAELCHERGLQLSIEPYGGWVGNFHDLEIASHADVPMGEFWALKPSDWCDWSIKLAASSAHARGISLVGAESYTSPPAQAKWTLAPSAMKTQGDLAFTQGLNRIIFHTYAHQPWPAAIQPGMTMAEYGMQFNRNNTWFRAGRAWIAYLSRCQFMLQQGEFVADLCYVADENAPERMRRREELTPSPPPGYDYDAITIEQFKTLTAANGNVQLPSGMRYRAVVLPDADEMRPEVLEHVARLADAGAIIIGRRPQASPSLQGYPECDATVRRLADALWSQQRVLPPMDSMADFLNDQGVPPDFDIAGHPSIRPFQYIHRRADDADVYFVSNQRKQRVETECVFRVQGARPELWHPESGAQEPAAQWRATPDGRTAVPLCLEAGESVFVIFTRRGPTNSHALEVSGPVGTFQRALSMPAVEILRAVYGVPGGGPESRFDVTETISDRLRNGATQIAVENNLGGDPAFGFVKALEIRYAIDGVERQQTVPEHEILYFDSYTGEGPVHPKSRLVCAGHRIDLCGYREGTYDVLLSDNQDVRVKVGSLPTPRELAGPWRVAFEPPPGLAAKVAEPTEFEQLESLSTHDNELISYFAGTAEYRTEFTVADDQIGSGQLFTLDLGQVEVIARVELNGVAQGVLWNSPYRVDVTDAVRVGENNLVVRVTTQWPNRLIGDDRLGESPSLWRGLQNPEVPAWVQAGEKSPGPGSTFSIWRHWGARDELLPAGLVGPVVLHSGQRITVFTGLPENE